MEGRLTGMEERKLSEMEKVLQKAVEELSRQVAELSVDLSLARAQVMVLKEENEAKKMKDSKK